MHMKYLHILPIAVLLAASCDMISEQNYSTPPAVAPEEVKGISLKAGQETDLFNTMYPTGNTGPVTFTSDDPSVAEVDGKGNVTGIAPGYTAITVEDGRGKYRIQVHVQDEIHMQMLDALTKPIDTGYAPEYDTLAVARGETATLQLLVFADNGASSPEPEVTLFAPEGSSGVTVVPELYWERYIPCTRMWYSWFGGAPSDELFADTYPDPLMPVDKWNVDIAAGEYAPLWIEFNIPRSAVPGLYRGEVSVTAGGKSGTYVFFTKVYDVTLPEDQEMSVIEWLDANLAPMNNNVAPDRDLRDELLEEAVIPMARKYGVNSFQMLSSFAFDVVKSAGTDPQTGKTIPVFDLSAYERDIEMFLRACPDLDMIHGLNVIAGTRDGGVFIMQGVYLDSNGDIVLENGNLKLGDYQDVTDYVPPQTEIYYGNYFKQLQAMLESHSLPDGRTWLDIYAQTIKDEPNDEAAPAWNAIARMIRKWAPGIKLVEPIETDLIDPELLDYPCPTLGAIAGNLAKGDQVQWMYICSQPQGDYANRFIRLPLIKTRIVHWVNYRYNAVGFLHWAFNYWSGVDDPYGDPSGEHMGGDTHLVYPGYHEIYPSIRLCAMRDGIRDFDLLRMVEKKSASQAEEFCTRLVQDNATYNTDVASFRQLRRDILEYLEE